MIDKFRRISCDFRPVVEVGRLLNGVDESAGGLALGEAEGDSRVETKIADSQGAVAGDLWDIDEGKRRAGYSVNTIRHRGGTDDEIGHPVGTSVNEI